MQAIKPTEAEILQKVTNITKNLWIPAKPAKNA